MTTPLWTDKFSILYEKKYLFEIIPNKQFDFNRKLNSLLRLSIYYSTIVYLFDRKKTNMFYIPFVVAIATYILSHRYRETFLNRLNTELMNNVQSDDELIKGLEGGKEPPQPQKNKGDIIKTNGQDTVLRVPKRNIDDRMFIKSIVSAVMKLQFDAEKMSIKDRDNHIIKKLSEMEKNGAF